MRTFKIDVTDGTECGWPTIAYLLVSCGDDVWSGAVDLDTMGLIHPMDMDWDANVDEATAHSIEGKIKDVLDKIAKKLYLQYPCIGPFRDGVSACDDEKVRGQLMDEIWAQLQNKEITV